MIIKQEKKKKIVILVIGLNKSGHLFVLVLCIIELFIIKQENTKSLTRFEPRSCIVGSTANEFIIIAFCYERAGLVAVSGREEH